MTVTSLIIHCSITAENGKRVPITIQYSNDDDGADDNNKDSNANANDGAKTTPTQLRQQVSNVTKIPLSQLRLIFRGKMIKDDDNQDVVKEYKLEQDCVLHCMGKPSEDNNNSADNADAATAPTASVTAPSVSVAAAATAAAPASSSNAAAAAGGGGTPPAFADPLQEALNLLRTHAATPDVYANAVTTLNKVLANIIANPMEEKYRKVKVHNPAFAKRLGNLVGARQAMLAVGFTQTTEDSGTQFYVLEASPEAWPALQAAKAKVEQAVADAKRVLDAAEAAAAAAANTPTGRSNIHNATASANPFGMPPGGGLPGALGGSGGGGANYIDPRAQAAVNLLTNPEAIQNTLRDPTFQQMLQDTPDMPPNVRQAYQMVANNPFMLNQLSRAFTDPRMANMLRDAMTVPHMRDQVQQAIDDPATQAQIQRNIQARQEMGGFGGMGGMGGGMMPPPMNSNNSSSNNNNNTSNPGSNATSSGSGTTTNNNRGSNDQSQTEEEMIAEAIRRSLRDNQ